MTEKVQPQEIEDIQTEIIEDIPSNEEILRIAEETREEFYRTTFEILRDMPIPEN